MAEETAPEVAEPNTTAITDIGADSGTNGESNQKRAREENESEEDKDGVSKKLKVDKSVEEERLEKLEEAGEEEEKSGPVSLGPKTFGSSVEMFEYFYKFLHHWPPYLKVNKYEHLMLLELLKKGHPEPEKKIGGGVCAFQIRNHPMWKSRCFFLIREDKSVDDFSFRKCVDHILPLPEEMQLKSHVNKALGGRGGGKGRGRGGGGKGGGRGRGGHGKGGKWRH
ncbi:protein EMBRYO DEFECTIVE 514 [Senna tora]|uniref:Protein EMBRYO DEFECTIVE 514 n=1 Tax=Senna tora TaxID=362788 RepID=A0A834X622_9FABA|nr:protein EMBRYO DEFECTIVE 514 [Senna tora]